MCGTYFRIAKNTNSRDHIHFKSYYEEKRRITWEATKACSRRALSMYKDYYDAINTLKQFKTIGNYIAHLELNGGHGVVSKDGVKTDSHHSWWVPMGVNPCDYCSKIEGPIRK